MYFFKLVSFEMIYIASAGECDIVGTKEKSIDGFCICKSGYMGSNCDTCEQSFYMSEKGFCVGKHLLRVPNKRPWTLN